MFLTGQVRNPVYAYTDHGNNLAISGQVHSGMGSRKMGKIGKECGRVLGMCEGEPETQ